MTTGLFARQHFFFFFLTSFEGESNFVNGTLPLSLSLCPNGSPTVLLVKRVMKHTQKKKCNCSLLPSLPHSPPTSFLSFFIPLVGKLSNNPIPPRNFKCPRPLCARNGLSFNQRRMYPVTNSPRFSHPLSYTYEGRKKKKNLFRGKIYFIQFICSLNITS